MMRKVSGMVQSVSGMVHMSVLNMTMLASTTIMIAIPRQIDILRQKFTLLIVICLAFDSPHDSNGDEYQIIAIRAP